MVEQLVGGVKAVGSAMKDVTVPFSSVTAGYAVAIVTEVSKLLHPYNEIIMMIMKVERW